MKRRVIIDLITGVEENENPSLLYDDIRQELQCCWHDVSFTMKHEDIAEQTEPSVIPTTNADWEEARKLIKEQTEPTCSKMEIVQKER